MSKNIIQKTDLHRIDKAEVESAEKDQRIELMVRYSDRMINQNLTVQSKRWIKKAILQREFRIDPFFWNNGGLALATNRYETTKVSNWKSNSVQVLLGKKQTIRLVDNTLYYYANYDRISHEVHAEVYDFLSNCKRDSTGAIMYRKETDAAFLDTLGMVAPFLIRYGIENNIDDAVNLAMTQFRSFLKYGMDDMSGLPYHGYDIKNNEKCGVIGWGRGIGWMLFGMCESLGWLRKNSEQYKELSGYISILFGVVLKYQKQDGAFSWQLQAVDGPSDSSVSGMIGYSLLRYSKLVNKEDEYKDVLSRIEESIIKQVSNIGTVSGSSAECWGFSMYPQRFEVNSWGQAFCTLFLIESISPSE